LLALWEVYREVPPVSETFAAFAGYKAPQKILAGHAAIPAPRQTDEASMRGLMEMLQQVPNG